MKRLCEETNISVHFATAAKTQNGTHAVTPLWMCYFTWRDFHSHIHPPTYWLRYHTVKNLPRPMWLHWHTTESFQFIFTTICGHIWMFFFSFCLCSLFSNMEKKQTVDSWFDSRVISYWDSWPAAHWSSLHLLCKQQFTFSQKSCKEACLNDFLY